MNGISSLQNMGMCAFAKRPVHVPGAKIETVNPSKRLISDCRGDIRDTIPTTAVVQHN